MKHSQLFIILQTNTGKVLAFSCNKVVRLGSNKAKKILELAKAIN